MSRFCVAGSGAGLAMALLLALLSGLSVAEEVEPLDVETILNTTSEKSDYIDERRCIQSARIREIEVLDDRHLVFRMSRDQYYLVQFDRRCPTMNRYSTIAYESTGTRVCALDSIHPLNGVGRGGSFMISCQIPGFQGIDPDQLSLLRDTLSGRGSQRLE